MVITGRLHFHPTKKLHPTSKPRSESSVILARCWVNMLRLFFSIFGQQHVTTKTFNSLQLGNLCLSVLLHGQSALKKTSKIHNRATSLLVKTKQHRLSLVAIYQQEPVHPSVSIPNIEVPNPRTLCHRWRCLRRTQALKTGQMAIHSELWVKKAWKLTYGWKIHCMRRLFSFFFAILVAAKSLRILITPNTFPSLHIPFAHFIVWKTINLSRDRNSESSYHIHLVVKKADPKQEDFDKGGKENTSSPAPMCLQEMIHHKQFVGVCGASSKSCLQHLHGLWYCEWWLHWSKKTCRNQYHVAVPPPT